MSCNQYDMAPDFRLSDQNGHKIRLCALRGQWVLLYFYPKDDTPGCTTEACSLQERLPQFSKMGLKVLGVSPDGLVSHKKFSERFDLSFSLLSDSTKEVIKAYGAWGPKMFMGKKYMGVVRSSFLIDPDGRIARVYYKVDPKEHALEVLKDLQELTLVRTAHF